MRLLFWPRHVNHVTSADEGKKIDARIKRIQIFKDGEHQSKMGKTLQLPYSNPYTTDTYINRFARYIDQNVSRTASPTFANLTITGSLQYGGTIDRLNQDIADVQDSLVVLNSGNDSTPLRTAGIEVYRSNNASNAFLHYTESTGAWTTGVTGISENLLVSVPSSAQMAAPNGSLLVYNSAAQTFTLGNTIPNATTFQQSTTYGAGASLLFEDISTGLQWSDGVNLKRNLAFTPAHYSIPPVMLSNASLQLQAPSASLVFTSSSGQILFGDYNGPCLAVDTSTSALALTNLNSDTTKLSLFIPSLNDSVPSSGPPITSFRNAGAMFLNRSLYFGPCDNPSIASPAVYRMCSPSIASASAGGVVDLQITNVLNTLGTPLPCVLTLDGPQSDLRLGSTTSTGASTHAHVAFDTTTGLTLTTAESTGAVAAFPITLNASTINVIGDTTVQNDFTVNGTLIQKKGVEACTPQLGTTVNANTVPTVIGGIIRHISAGWFELICTLTFVPAEDNESSLVNVLLPNAFSNGTISSYAQVFPTILTAWRQPSTTNLIPMEGVHVLPLINTNQIQIYFNSDSTEPVYISFSVVYQGQETTSSQ